MPQRPPNKIADPTWEFLEGCWSRDRTKRPSITQVCDALLQSPSPPRFVHTPEGGAGAEELPGKLKLQVQSIQISLNKPKQRKFSVKFKYGNKDHTTSLSTKAAAGDEHTWFVFYPLYLPHHQTLNREVSETWLIETDEHNHGQPVTFEVFRTRTLVFMKNKVCATGKFSVSP